MKTHVRPVKRQVYRPPADRRPNWLVLRGQDYHMLFMPPASFNPLYDEARRWQKPRAGLRPRHR